MKPGVQFAYAVVGFFVLGALLVSQMRGRVGDSEAPQRPPEMSFAADPRINAIQARTAAKEDVARELIAGRLTLLQAAAAFRDLNVQAGSDGIRFAFRGAPSDESYCRSVIECIRDVAPPGQRDDLVRGLRAEVAARRRDGTLRLPDPSADEAQGG